MASTVPSLVSVPLQGLPIAAAVLDHDRVILAANHQFTRLAGQDTTVPGRPFVDIVADPDKPIVQDALNGLAALDTRVPHRCSVTALRAKTPSLWLAIDVSSLGPQSAVPYLACLQAMPRHRRRGGSAERRLQPGCRRAQDLEWELGAAAARRQTDKWPPLLMTLSHEFRGPLTAIRGWTQMAQSGLLPPEKLSRALSVISRNASSLSDLIDKLFDLSRRAAGSLTLKRRLVDLTPLTELVVDSCLPAARHRSVILTVSRSRSALPVHADPLRLEQIIRNLLENAMKFTPVGGHVHVHTGRSGPYAELVVSDNGHGISPDLLTEIFEPFRTDDGTLGPSERGLGLGLALVKQLVELHEGEVRALSNGKGQGATFIVRLPLSRSAAAA
jgi:signal transduction histidine kinase